MKFRIVKAHRAGRPIFMPQWRRGWLLGLLTFNRGWNWFYSTPFKDVDAEKRYFYELENAIEFVKVNRLKPPFTTVWEDEA